MVEASDKDGAEDAKPPLLAARGLSKRFPGVQALDGVSLRVERGEVLALVGENGAGKSTLMKILAGEQPPDAGEILLDGRPIVIDSVPTALAHGIALIHQELNLADNLSVASNLFLGREPRWAGPLGLIDWGEQNRAARGLLDRVGLDCHPGTIVRTLTIGKQQLVEIAKSLSTGARIIIMDEPTSSLSQHETERLYAVVRDLKSQGVSVIYISHRLGEVKELADRVMVMRDGKNAGELAGDKIHRDAMVRMMVGREVSQFYARRQHARGGPLLEVRDLVVPGKRRHEVSFTVHAGEIVGIAGLVGAGRTELARVLFGIDRALGGEILIRGRPVSIQHPIDAIQAGVALVPEDRKQQGLVIEMSVRENITLASLNESTKGGLIARSVDRSRASELAQKLRVRTPTVEQRVQLLSGGNQQKVALAKWLALGPSVLILDEPTRGIDVGAKEEIYQLMEKLAEQGKAVLFVSSDLEEILGMSDRAIVMHEGRIAGELSRAELSDESIMQLATGGSWTGRSAG